MVNLALDSREIHQPSTIMVMIATDIHWMLYAICYGAGSTCAGYIAEMDVWEELSQKILNIVLLVIRGGSCKFGALVKVASSAARVIMVDL